MWRHYFLSSNRFSTTAGCSDVEHDLFYLFYHTPETFRGAPECGVTLGIRAQRRLSLCQTCVLLSRISSLVSVCICGKRSILHSVIFQRATTQTQEHFQHQFQPLDSPEGTFPVCFSGFVAPFSPFLLVITVISIHLGRR